MKKGAGVVPLVSWQNHVGVVRRNM